MTAPITFHGSEMVATLAAPDARRRLLPANDNVVVLTADRLTLTPNLPCYESNGRPGCVREPTCRILDKIGPRSLDALLPPQIDPELKINVWAEVECAKFVPNRPSETTAWHIRALSLGTAALLGVVFTAAALLSGIVQMNPR